MSMYTKLFAKILDSSIWLESDPTRLVWITLLAAMDEDGFAQFSAIGNLANRARVSLDQAEEAVTTLESPDRHNPGQLYEGRRIERVPGGFMVLKASEYGAIVKREHLLAKNRDRVRRHREKHGSNGGVMPCNDSVTPLDIDVHADVPLAALAVEPPPPTRQKPLGYKHRIDMAWPGRPPVPGSLHEEFIVKLGGDPEDARRRLGEWYPKAAAEYEHQPIGDDDFKFWRARFREWVGTTEKPAVSVVPMQTADEAWAELEARKALRKRR